VDCGTTAPAQTFTLSNTGTATFTWTAALTKGGSSPYTVLPTSGSITPGGTPQTITVTPKAIPSASAVTAGLYDDTLTISSSAFGDTGTPIALQETAHGAILA